MSQVAPRARLVHIVHKGVPIIKLDYTQVEGLPDIETTKAFYEQAHEEIASHPPKSVRILTIPGAKMRFNAELLTLQREFASSNSPYVEKSAVVAADSPMGGAIMSTLRFLVGRDIPTFDSVEEALDWLAE